MKNFYFWNCISKFKVIHFLNDKFYVYRHYDNCVVKIGAGGAYLEEDHLQNHFT